MISKKWEYRCFEVERHQDRELAFQCDRLGEEGWELVSVCSYETSFKSLIGVPEITLRLFFKREMV